MTHNELLARIEYKKEDYYADDQTLDALRAVVKLHKPKDFAIDTDFPWVGCKECERLYPCPTIQAIEEKLK